MEQQAKTRKSYTSALTDAQWAIVVPMIPVWKVGRERKTDMREVLKPQMHVLDACEEKIHRITDLPSALGAWTNFFYFSHIKTEDEMTALLQDHPPVAEAYRKYLHFNQDERLRSIDEAHQRFLMDIASDRAEARAEARAEGRAEGKAEGKVERDIEIARNLKSMGLGTTQIVQATGLSLSVIEQLN